MSNSEAACVVLSTCGSAEEAAKIADALVRERLAACVNRVPGITSVYEWKGGICEDAEVLLVIKTRRALVPEIEKRCKELHSYDTPELIALPVEAGARKYLDWLLANTKK